jgi:maltose-binding protein MalE
MQRKQILSGLALGAALIAPVALKAQDEKPREESRKTTTTTTTTETKRYYDTEEKTYRVWSDQEDRAYRRYLEENHRDYVEFPKVKVTEQREYFKWRHHHPELFKSERTTEEKEKN